MVSKFGTAAFLVHILFGIYFINYQLGFIKIPESFSNFEPWIIFIGGILIFIGGINYLRASRRSQRYTPR